MATEQDYQMDFSNTPADLVLPDQFYNWEITALDISEAGKNKTMCNVCNQPRGKKMIVVTFNVIEPLDYKDAQVRENFTVGIDTDPCAHNAATLTGRVFGAVYFGQLLDATQTPRNQMRSLIGKRCQRSTVIVEIEGNDGKRKINNFARGVYPIGTVPVGQPTSPSDNGRKPSTSGSFKSSAPQRMIPCPACKEEFSELEIDDHVSTHSPR